MSRRGIPRALVLSGWLTAFLVGLAAAASPAGPRTGPAGATGPRQPAPPAVRKVRFIGNESFGSRDLIRWMTLQPSRPLSRVRFDPDVFGSDLDRIATFYKGEGFLRATVTGSVLPVRRNRADLEIRITEGPRWKLIESDLLMFGEAGTPTLRDSLLAALEIRPPGPYRTQRIVSDRIRMVSRLASAAYLDARVEVQENRNDSCRTARLRYLVTPGPRARADVIRIEGLVHTRPETVLRELALRPGGLINIEAAGISKANLLRTGLFSEALIEPDPADSNKAWKALVVRLREIPGGELSAGAGYGTSDRLRILAGLEHRNLGGRGIRGTVTGRYGERRRGADAELSFPWVGNRRQSLSFNAGYEKISRPAFRAERTRGGFGSSRDLGRFWRAEASYRMERVVLLARTQTGAGPNRLRIGSIGLTLARDTRTDIARPRGGTYLSLSHELALPAFGSSRRFSRTELRRMRFYPRGPATFASRLQAGWIGISAPVREVPVSERYFAGGPRTIRGFPEDRIGPLDASGRPLGGRVLLLVSAEMHAPLYRIIGIAFFADAGTLVESASAIRPASWSIGAGPGLDIESPVGRIRLEAGFPVTRPRAEHVQFYAGTGAAF